MLEDRINQGIRRGSKTIWASSTEMKLKLSLILLVFVASVEDVHAQALDALRGHLRDFRNRFDDHQRLNGQILKRGEIDTKAKGQDLVHNSSGTWYLVKFGHRLYLQSGEDFRSSPGPRLSRLCEQWPSDQGQSRIWTAAGRGGPTGKA